MNSVLVAAADCLKDDPSFRLLTSIEDQRAEARLILAAMPGGSPEMADDVILLALEDLDDDETEEVSIDVSKPDFAAEKWTTRRLKVTVPKRNKRGRPPKAVTLDKVAIEDIPVQTLNDSAVRKQARASMMRDRRVQLTKERAERAAKRWAPKPRAGIIESKRELLGLIKACLGNSQTALATTLGVSRATVDACLGGRLEWHPTTDQMATLKKMLLRHQDMITETLIFIEQIEGNVENA